MQVWRGRSASLVQRQVVLANTTCSQFRNIQRFCTSSVDSGLRPEVLEMKKLFRESKTCALLRDRNQDIFIIGDMHGSDESVQRVKDTIDILKPRILVVEEVPERHAFPDRAHPKFRGQFHSNSYLDRYAKMYPTLGPKLRSTSTQSLKLHVDEIMWHVQKREQEIQAARDESAPFDAQWTKPYCLPLPSGDALDMSLSREADRGFLKGQISLYVSSHVARRRRNMPAGNSKVPLGWAFVYSEANPEERALDEKAEQQALDELTMLTKFNEVEMFSQNRYAVKVDPLKTFADFESLPNSNDVRNAVLNRLFRLVELEGDDNAERFFHAIHMVWCGRERDIIRQLRQKMFDEYVNRNQRVMDHFKEVVSADLKRRGDDSFADPNPELVAAEVQKYRESTKFDEVPIGPVLCVVTMGHVQGLVNLWNNPDFWATEVQNFNDYVSFIYNKDTRDEYMRDVRRMAKAKHGIELKEEDLVQKEYSNEELEEMEAKLSRWQRAGKGRF